MKIEPGTKVRIVNYGHPYWTDKTQWNCLFVAGFANDEIPKNILKDTGDMWCFDAMPELIGLEGIVSSVIEKFGTDKHSYSLSGIPSKASWYNREQLEVI